MANHACQFNLTRVIMLYCGCCRCYYDYDDDNACHDYDNADIKSAFIALSVLPQFQVACYHYRYQHTPTSSFAIIPSLFFRV